MTKSKRLHIRITEDMQEKLKAAADKDGRTVANLVTKLISDYLEEERKLSSISIDKERRKHGRTN